jgi:hypothetical protein
MRTYAKVMRYGSLHDLLHNETLELDDRYACLFKSMFSISTRGSDPQQVEQHVLHIHLRQCLNRNSCDIYI